MSHFRLHSTVYNKKRPTLASHESSLFFLGTCFKVGSPGLVMCSMRSLKGPGPFYLFQLYVSLWWFSWSQDCAWLSTYSIVFQPGRAWRSEGWKLHHLSLLTFIKLRIYNFLGSSTYSILMISHCVTWPPQSMENQGLFFFFLKLGLLSSLVKLSFCQERIWEWPLGRQLALSTH